MNGSRFEISSKLKLHEPTRAASPWLAAVAVLALALAGGAASADPPAPADLIMPPEDAELIESGVISKVIAAGTGERPPEPGDIVAVHFIGWSPAGEKLYSSYDQGRPVRFPIERLFPGWRQAVLRMVHQEKRRIWLPDHLVATEVGPKGASIIQLELVGIKRTPKPPANLDRPPETAEKTSSGAFTEVLRPGTGSEHPAADSPVLVNYIGWTADGKTFDSTASRGRPTAFPLDGIMPAFAEAMQQMVVGEKRRIWIPGPVAKGNWIGSPKGMLIFEVELLKILPAETFQKKPEGEPAAGAGSP